MIGYRASSEGQNASGGYGYVLGWSIGNGMSLRPWDDVRAGTENCLRAK